ncbi:hypothetical protein HPB50_022004 [Hyalomma asiaticum]|uniref:Uncharacterized protein n=1 Tax=Hyalomma asiaticum TaxID=266040 RepID=A0ACB7SZ61_HYAAI|nr:hypothetical protein HPB50_022004 [Hyalomma asiaticum]
MDIHKELEQKIARFHGREDAILYASCFDANAGIFEVLLGPEDAVLSDELNHASIIDGIRLCKAQKYRYKHRDMNGLRVECGDSASVDALIKRTVKLTEVSERTLCRWKTEMEDAGEVLPPKKCSCGKGRDRTKKLHDFDLSVLRRVVHGFFEKGEIQANAKVVQRFKEDKDTTDRVHDNDAEDAEKAWV